MKKSFRNALILLAVFSLSFLVFMKASEAFGIYAALSSAEPNSTIVIGETEDSFDFMFDSNGMGAAVLAPGEAQTGIVRIINKSGENMTVTRLGAEFVLEKDGKRVNYDASMNNLDKKNKIGNGFMTKMTMTIGYLNPFDHMVRQELFDATFLELTHGFDFDYKLKNNEFVDLVYTLSFDGTATAELAGISALSDFLVGVEGDKPGNGNNGNSGNGGIGSGGGVVNNPNNDLTEIDDDELAQSEVTDISSHYAQDEIEYLIDMGLVQGYPDGTLRPDWTTTRAEVAAMLATVYSLKEDGDFLSPFSDELPMWAEENIKAVTKGGIFGGYPDGTFRANRLISREEFAKVVAIAIKLDITDSSSVYTDALSDRWSAVYLKVCHEAELMEGYPDGTFRPENSITRAEMFIVIYRMITDGYIEGGIY